MNIKTIIFTMALAISSSASFAQECNSTTPCTDKKSPDLVEKAKGWLGSLAESVSKGSAAVAESMKDKKTVWPDAAESSSVQLFPSYPGSITCVRSAMEALGKPQDDQAHYCADMDKKMRSTYYHYITFVPAEFAYKTDGVQENSRYAFKGVSVVSMPRLANSITCWKADVEGDGAKECQALRSILKGTPFKYVVIPNASKMQEIARFNSSMK